MVIVEIKGKHEKNVEHRLGVSLHKAAITAAGLSKLSLD